MEASLQIMKNILKRFTIEMTPKQCKQIDALVKGSGDGFSCLAIEPLSGIRRGRPRYIFKVNVLSPDFSDTLKAEITRAKEDDARWSVKRKKKAQPHDPFFGTPNKPNGHRNECECTACKELNGRDFKG
jgi:hypothetical protein